MKRLFAILLALAMTLSLAACGGGGTASSGSSSSSSPSSSNSSGSAGSSDGSSSSAASGSASASGSSSSAVSGSQASSSDGSTAGSSSAETPGGGQASVLTLNKTSISLSTAGATFRLRYTCEPEISGAKASFSSSKEGVATVSEDGTVTAVAPGVAVITLRYGDLTAKCTCNCNWEWETPPPAQSTQPSQPTQPEQPAQPQQPPQPEQPAQPQQPAQPEQPAQPQQPVQPEQPSQSEQPVQPEQPSQPEQPTQPEQPAQPEQPSDGSGSTFTTDLAAFYNKAVTDAGEFPMMMPLDDDMLESFYPGLTGIERSQTVANMAAISAISCEIILVEVKNAADVKTVQDIFQTRINNMVSDHMQYPETTEVWTNNAQVVTRGNCVCLFAMNPDFGDFASAFRAL